MLFVHYLNEETPDTSEHHLLIHNDIQQIPQLADFVETIAEEKHLDHSLTLSLRKAATTKGGKVVVRDLSADVRNVFMITGFLNLFEIQ